MVEPTAEYHHLTVVARPRHVRVAYLIDSESASVRLLEGIFAGSSRVWGGRLAPIIPVVDGGISPDYWQLLRHVDPDWIYSYTPVQQSLADRLCAEIGPLDVRRHPSFGMEGGHFRPSFVSELIRVHELLPFATERRWFTSPPLVSCSGAGDVDPLIERNFGVLRNDILSEEIPAEVPQIQFEHTLNFPGFLELVSRDRRDVVFPYRATYTRGTLGTSMASLNAGYCVYVGDALSDWLAFWNHIFSVRLDRRESWDSLCIPASLFSDASTIGALVKFLRTHAVGGGQGPPHVDWISSTASEHELRSLLEPITSQVKNVVHGFKIREEWSAPEIKPSRTRSFSLDGKRFGQSEALPASIHQIPSTGGLVDLPELPFRLGHDVRWMQDVEIQYRADEPYYTNEELLYRLPRRSLITTRFCALPGRVTLNGNLAIEMRPNAPLVLRIPTDRDLLIDSIGCGRRVRYTGDLERQDIPPAYERHGSSDKAKYLIGVRRLFGGLASAHRVLTNRFWRRNMFRLTSVANDSSELVNKLAKQPELWNLNPDEDHFSELQRIAAMIVVHARHVKSAEVEVTYEYLRSDLKREQREALSYYPDLIGEMGRSDEELWLEMEVQLKERLQGFVNSNILQQGIVSRCGDCATRIWLELSAIKQRFECPGCGAVTHSAVESRWFYRLNSLVRKAISEHGTVPLIHALAAARERARVGFIYAPGFIFYKQYDDPDPVTEVDAVCLIDGELWAGEVKTNVREFTVREFKKLIRDASSLGADKAFVFAQEGDQDALHARCISFASATGPQIIHLRPDPSLMEPSYFI